MKYHLHEIAGYIQSIYLVEQQGVFFLLDGCSRPDVEVVKHYLEQVLGKSIYDLKLVIATHAHPDHFGGVSFFKNLYDIPVAGPAQVNSWYAGSFGFFTYCTDILLTYLVAVNKKKPIRNILFPRSVNLDYILRDQDVVPGFESWQVLVCPGHTDMDLSLYHSGDNLAYIADNLVGKKNKVFRPYPLIRPDLYRETLTRYINLGIENFLIAHYGKVRVTKQQLESLIRSIPNEPRRHLTTLPRILLKLLKAFFRKKSQ